MLRRRLRFAWILALALWAGWSFAIRSQPVRAVDYDSLALECLVAASDAIVLGRVDRDPSGAYRLEVAERVTGERLAGRQSFEISPWQGPVTRPLGTALLFLRRPAGRQSLEVVGPSAEGWLPVQDGHVRLVGISIRRTGEQAPTDPPQLDLPTLVNALRGLEECVKWSRNPERGRVRATLICDEARRTALGRQSAVADYLVKAATRATSGDGLPCPAVAVGIRPRR